MSKPPTLPPDLTALLQQLADASRNVYGWMAGLGVPPEDQPDLAQDVTKEALENIGTYDPAKGEIGAWLYGIAEKIVARYHEKRIRRGNITLPPVERPAVASPEKLIVGTELDHVVREVLAGLDALDRQLLMERFYLDRSYIEIGEAHGMTKDAARMRVERALILMEHVLRSRGIEDARRGVLPLPLFRRETIHEEGTCTASVKPPAPPSSRACSAARWLERAAAAGLIVYLLLRPAPPEPVATTVRGADRTLSAAAAVAAASLPREAPPSSCPPAPVAAPAPSPRPCAREPEDPSARERHLLRQAVVAAERKDRATAAKAFNAYKEKGDTWEVGAELGPQLGAAE
jgi:RNA polymerase sigma-70 factor (ECF subfamily)